MLDRPGNNVHRSPWLKATEAAAYLGVTLGTLRNLTSQRRVPFSRNGGIVRYHVAVLDEWLAQTSCPGRPTVADVNGDER